jgi:hypothetical protein
MNEEDKKEEIPEKLNFDLLKFAAESFEEGASSISSISKINKNLQ